MHLSISLHQVTEPCQSPGIFNDHFPLLSVMLIQAAPAGQKTSLSAMKGSL